MQTRALQTLIRVSQLGSFARASEEMHTTVSTVSMQIKSIEDQLGVEIFDRSHRPPKLTPIGRTVCERAQSVIRAEKDLLELTENGDALSGSFKIGFVATASVRLLPGFLKKARAVENSVTFEFETALSEVLEARVRSGALDAAVVTESQENSPGLEYQILRSEKLMFAMPSAYARTPIDELRAHLPFLQFNPGSGIGKLIQRHMVEIAIPPKQADIVLESVEAIIACVNEGLGFTLLAEPDIRRYASENCHILPMPGTGISRNLSLAVSQVGLSKSTQAHLVDFFG